MNSWVTKPTDCEKTTIYDVSINGEPLAKV